ncbi:MAG: hypothetical protein NVS2B1_17830 [Bradyrhizobium sp.]
MAKDSPLGKSPESRRGKQIRSGERHPLFGALKDVTFVPPEVDLTEPADPEWADISEQDSAPPTRR